MALAILEIYIKEELKEAKAKSTEVDIDSLINKLVSESKKNGNIFELMERTGYDEETIKILLLQIYHREYHRLQS